MKQKMVCAKCEVKLKRVITPDPWMQKVNASAKSSGATSTKLNENKALSSSKNYVLGSQQCQVCKKSLHQPGLFCQPCAFQQGKCAMCGVEVQDVSMHNVGGDLERKLREKTTREKSEKLMKLEKLEEERDKGRKRRGKGKRGKEKRRKRRRKRVKKKARKRRRLLKSNQLGRQTWSVRYCNNPPVRRRRRHLGNTTAKAGITSTRRRCSITIRRPSCTFVAERING